MPPLGHGDVRMYPSWGGGMAVLGAGPDPHRRTQNDLEGGFMSGWLAPRLEKSINLQ